MKSLHHAGISAEAIHGNKSQNQRERVLGAFRAGKLKTLVATDIAARGIDVDGISHVINYDLPNIPESYVHRIGRTARAGADGHRDLVLRQRGARVPARHREADPDEAARRPSGGPRRATMLPAPHHRPQQNAGRNGRNGQPPQRSAAAAQWRRQRPQRPAAPQRARRPAAQSSGPAAAQRQCRHAPAAAASSPDNIGTVAFMRQPQPRQPQAGDANRNTR